LKEVTLLLTKLLLKRSSLISHLGFTYDTGLYEDIGVMIKVFCVRFTFVVFTLYFYMILHGQVSSFCMEHA